MSNNTSLDIWIAGAVAAFTVDLVVYPLDTIKTRFQSPDYAARFTNGNSAALFRGVYQGVGSVILATLPSSGAFFTTYEGMKTILEKPRSGSQKPFLPQPLIHALASGSAELVSCAILTPAEVIKQNAQMVDTSKASHGANATWQTLQRFRANPLALWRGYAALAGRNLPFTALQFPLFERLKRAIKQHRDETGVRSHSLLESALITAASAGLGGSVAAVVTTPVDVIKTRIMLSAGEESGGKDNAKPRPTSLGLAKEILREQGVKGLFRGGALRAVWTLMGSGLYLGVYESGRVYLAQRRGEEANPEDFE